MNLSFLLLWRSQSKRWISGFYILLRITNWTPDVLKQQLATKKKAMEQSKLEFYSHPALISTPPTTWAWTLQVRKALERLKLGITTLETLSPSLVKELLGRVYLSSCHSMAAPRWITRGQLSPTTHEADTDDPRGTTKLGAWIFAHGCTPSSNSDDVRRKQKQHLSWEFRSHYSHIQTLNVD